MPPAAVMAVRPAVIQADTLGVIVRLERSAVPAIIPADQSLVLVAIIRADRSRVPAAIVPAGQWRDRQAVIAPRVSPVSNGRQRRPSDLGPQPRHNPRNVSDTVRMTTANTGASGVMTSHAPA